MTGTITINGALFTYSAMMVDTSYGPENRVTFRDDLGNPVRQHQEPMRTAEIVSMFEDEMS